MLVKVTITATLYESFFCGNDPAEMEHNAIIDWIKDCSASVIAGAEIGYDFVDRPAEIPQMQGTAASLEKLTIKRPTPGEE